MKTIRVLAVLALLAAALAGGLAVPSGSAHAADAIFPQGVRVGLVPLVGLAKSKSFPGFESEDQTVKVLVTELPADAYSEIKTAFTANPQGAAGIKPHSIETPAGTAYYTAEDGKEGTTNLRRYSMIVSGGTFSGYVAVQIPENATKIYTDDAVRQMFASAVLRKEVPIDEQLEQMPFRVTELSSFKNVRTLAPGAALILADGDEASGFEPSPFMIVGIIGAKAPDPDDRARFAQQTARQIPGVREARITMSEPIRVDGMPAFETRIDAVSGKDNTAVTIVQWLRFNGPQIMRIVGSAPRDQWSDAFPRFRAVRDGIKTRG
ncbi:MAG: hypothetical protein JO010_13245 [Alphaproteobacteria bacterium]|nr:hypothetical protein [Alphaproteobacteria bacterium]